MSRDLLVHFPAFRHHEASRKDANNAMMALLVGAQVSSQFLELSRGSSKLLSEIFPSIAHIKRFDLTPDDARPILLGAEQHLGAMAVPQALAIHEAFVLDCLELLGIRAAKAFEMHDKLAAQANGSFSPELLQRFHVLREMRNSIIHRSGTANQRLVDAISDLSTASQSDWRRLAGRSPRGIMVGDQVTLLLGELVLALATTKALAREANRLLVATLSPKEWAEVIIADHLEQTPRQLNPSARRRAIEGLRRFHYAAITVGIPDLETAAAARGIQMA